MVLKPNPEITKINKNQEKELLKNLLVFGYLPGGQFSRFRPPKCYQKSMKIDSREVPAVKNLIFGRYAEYTGLANKNQGFCIEKLCQNRKESSKYREKQAFEKRHHFFK